MTDRNLRRTMLLGLVLIITSGLGAVALEIYQVVATAPELKRSRELVVRTFEVMTTAQDLYREVQAAERAVRAFLNTGNAADLDPYRASTQASSELLAKLKQQTADNPDQQRRLPNIELQIYVRFAELESIVQISKTWDPDAARLILQSNAPLVAMRAIGGLTDAAIAAEKALLTERMARAAEDERRTRDVALAGMALALVLMTLGAVLVPLAFSRLRSVERARRESEERFGLLVRGATDYAIYMLDAEGRVTSWNAGAERIKGYAADEIIGRQFSCFYTEDERKADAPGRSLEAAARKGKYEAEAWRVRKDGSRFFASVVINPLRDPSGRLVGFANITRDITERLQQRDALEKTRAALAQAQKMEALGQLSGGIAHDFNNLLHVIKNAIDGLQRRMPKVDPDVGMFLDMAKRNADRAATLTQRLLAFSRSQPLEPKSVNPNKLVVGMTELLRQTLGESIAIESALGGGVWWTLADANQLETAILNLAVNARDAMPHGGKLTIETTNAYLDEPYAAAHEAVKAGQYVLIAVSDTGAGMTKEVIAKAFEPFFTTKGVGEGTGLGLSQVYGFIKQSGGHIKIYSEPGEGTTVKLYLPRLTVGQSAEALTAARPVLAETAQETILLVEDDEDVCATTAEALSDLGYRVLTASDAKRALSVLENEPEVSLLFTDVGLPNGINGRQLADEARRRWPRLRVLFTTAYARNAIVHHGRLDPGVALIVKPFTQSDLALRIRSVLDGTEGMSVQRAPRSAATK